MAQVTITINSRGYAVACEDGQEVRIMQLARMLDDKAKLITQGAGQVNECMLLAMVGLLLADEINELKRGDSSPASQAPEKSSGADSSRLLEIDQKLSNQLKNLTNELNSVANNINLL